MTAIVAGYDGTLCPISRVGSDVSGKNEIPGELVKVLSLVSDSIPICILSSKDYQFLYFRAPFAKMFSCIAGTETLLMAKESSDVQRTHTISSRHLLVDERLLLASASILEQFAEDVASRFPSMIVNRKFTVDRMLAGLTFDWRHLEDWNAYKFAINDYIEKAVFREPYCYLRPLYFQSYQMHPFVDVYPVETNKTAGFDCIKAEVYHHSSAELPQRIMYLGDSEEDNDTFRKADISIGVLSDERVAGVKLSCDYTMEFDRLAPFLQRLRKNNFVFSETIL